LGYRPRRPTEPGYSVWRPGLAARAAGGSQQRLLVAFVVVAAATTTVLSNDATALLLTPVAFAVATRLGPDPRPYAFARTLVADAASFVLPVSNPTNLLVLSQAPLLLGEFLIRLLVPSVLALSLLESPRHDQMNQSRISSSQARRANTTLLDARS
jgi:arsenical pump membrane protein